MTVAIIDYGSGNLHSAAKAFERAARSMEDPQAIKVTRDPDAVYRADRIVLPGVGAFADCRRGVDAVDGRVQLPLDGQLLGRGAPHGRPRVQPTGEPVTEHGVGADRRHRPEDRADVRVVDDVLEHEHGARLCEHLGG